MITLVTRVTIGIITLSGIIFVINKMKEMKTKENIKKMKEMKTKENIKRMKEMGKKMKEITETNMKEMVTKDIKKTKETKGFSEIENISRNLVEIKEIQIENENVSTAYLLKVAGIDIRLYFNFTDAYRVGIFMKGIVRDVIRNGYAKIDVKELKTDNDTYYLLQIANKNVKIYTGVEEATMVAKYMTNVVNTILEKI